MSAGHLNEQAESCTMLAGLGEGRGGEGRVQGRTAKTGAMLNLQGERLHERPSVPGWPQCSGHH